MDKGGREAERGEDAANEAVIHRVKGFGIIHKDKRTTRRARPIRHVMEALDSGGGVRHGTPRDSGLKLRDNAFHEGTQTLLEDSLTN